ncbi:TIGR04255 family protein [Aquidulcibacter sp.]|uniref:TIGR04255 family protein n=1 Tax=Aquidulcibacter sp. TaxID=2052990 RepID=UPI0025BDE766|nr:TIGR04255 family protein [Aquidulcibacter sp.]MCA3691767.1 TIGR04255 family protein [Aquidulcibacter sp.]
MRTKYKASPLAEMAIAFQFEPEPTFQAVHLGRFTEFLRDDYPTPLTQPPMEIAIERPFGTEITQQMFFPGQVEIPRAWMISKDQSKLVQFQNSKLVFNWRRAESKTVYPSFESALDEFLRILGALREFWLSEFGREPKTTQVELVYVNLIIPPNREVVRLSEAIPFLKDLIAINLPIQIDGLSQTFSSKLKDIDGRLHVGIQLITRQPMEGHEVRLELIARGLPEALDHKGISTWFDRAHSQITEKFNTVTSEKFRIEVWGAYRHV